jgi:GTP cyclohydrolase IIa
LQILQAELYSSLQQSFAAYNGLVFFNRFDEMLAVTNGMSREEHRELQQNVSENFPFSVSMSVGVDRSPYQANVRASRMMQKAGSAQSERRKGVLVCDPPLALEEAYAHIIHIDVDGITKLTDHHDAFETSQKLMHTYVELMNVFRQLESLVFYLGGDNFMGVIGELAERDIADKLRDVNLNSLWLKFGVGRAETARKAAEIAAMGLEQIRHERSYAISTSKL